jgi:type II secretory pathway pseudopilin PulG
LGRHDHPRENHTLMPTALWLVTLLGAMTPWLLLALTFALGMGFAALLPAWQAIQPYLVSRSELPQAVILVGVNVNVSRAIGPAVGGLLIVAAGPAAVFLINAVLFSEVSPTLAASWSMWGCAGFASVASWRWEKGNPLSKEREEGGFVNTTLLIVIVVVVVVAALVAFFVFRRGQQRGRQEEARQEYGPEYERTVEERGSEREAEQELRERRGRVESEVRPLSEESRKRYTERWRRVEQTFVDDPTASLNDADRVVRDILEERNFPTDSRQEASEGVGVTHPGVVEDFREAQRIHQEVSGSRDQNGPALEKVRQAIQKYRSVYERLTRE